NGDKFTVRTEGTDTVKDGRPQSSTGTWSFASGTGKIKGIQGKGTYKGKPDADGTMVSRLRANTRCRNNLSRVKSAEYAVWRKPSQRSGAVRVLCLERKIRGWWD